MSSGSPFLACMMRAEKRRLALQAAERRQLDSQPMADQSIASQSPSSEPTNNRSNAGTAVPGNDITASATSVIPKKKKVQNVLTIAQRLRVLQWMIETNDREGPKHIASKAVKHFPLLFRTSPNADIMRAMRIWKQRDHYQIQDGNIKRRGVASCITRKTSHGFKQVRLKAHEGRGRKRAKWVDHLHQDLHAEFDRMRKAGVKFSLSTIRLLALRLIEESSNGIYGKGLIDKNSGMRHEDKIDLRWVQAFADRYRIVSRSQSGKLQLSPAKQLEVEQEVARHLGKMKKGFESGEYDENHMSNADETHFIINMDNGKTMGFCGDKEVKYADVTSGGEGMTMLIRLSGGRKARIEPPLMIFKNKTRSYPIRGVPDDVPGVAYRSGPRGWMDTTIMKEWLREPRVIKKLPHKKCVICSWTIAAVTILMKKLSLLPKTF